jgi:Lamin Tail Domain
VPNRLLRLPRKFVNPSFIAKALVAAVALVGIKVSTGPTSAYAAGEAVRITEVSAWGSGNGPYAADWFELTNTGTVALNPSTWKFDDSSNLFSAALILNGISSIAPGESVIYLEVGATATPATVAAAFRTSWFGANPPAGLQIGSYTGSGAGLSTAGDSVNIFDSAGTVITGVNFGASPGTIPFATFDNAAGASGNGTTNPTLSTLSVAGTNGAFLSVDAPTATPVHGIGSPGKIANATSSGSTTTLGSSTTTTTTVVAPVVAAWPGGQSVVAVDPLNTYSSNLSGLDYEPSGSAAPGVMWAVRNGGPNALYRLIRNGSGQWVSDTANGWSAGKNVLFPSGTGNPDAEGVTMGGYSSAAGMFVSTERNNDTSATSRNAILRFDVTGSTSTLTANGDWNITADIPANGANLGLEGITWVPDSYLVANGFRNSAGALYVPSAFPNHGSGLFLVGVEGGGAIHAYALNLTDGSTFIKVATFNSTLVDTRGYNSVMDLQFDNETNELWAVCDDGCSGRSAVFRINPTSGTFTRVALFERPTDLPNTNNEGFTFAPIAECSGGNRPAFWADDNNVGGNALRQGTLRCAAVSNLITATPTPTTTSAVTTTVPGAITITAPSTTRGLVFPPIPDPTTTTVATTVPPTTLPPTTVPVTTVAPTTTTSTTTTSTTKAPTTTVPVTTTTEASPTTKAPRVVKPRICLRFAKRGVNLSNGKYVVRVYCAKFKK